MNLYRLPRLCALLVIFCALTLQARILRAQEPEPLLGGVKLDLSRSAVALIEDSKTACSGVLDIKFCPKRAEFLNKVLTSTRVYCDMGELDQR